MSDARLDTRARSRARSRALQAVYAWDMRAQEQPLARTAMLVWDDLGVDPAERAFAARLTTAMEADLTPIDADLATVTTNWRLERLGAVERCVLRLAAAELRTLDTPPRVVLQEAVRLAERYGSEQSAKFVNGVLDALARKLGKL
jgi:transcription antitermination protein NusB